MSYADTIDLGSERMETNMVTRTQLARARTRRSILRYRMPRERGEVGQTMRGGDCEFAVSRTGDNKAAPTLSNGDNCRGDLISHSDLRQ